MTRLPTISRVLERLRGGERIKRDSLELLRRGIFIEVGQALLHFLPSLALVFIFLHSNFVVYVLVSFFKGIVNIQFRYFSLCLVFFQNILFFLLFPVV